MTAGLFERLGVKREGVQRGARADLWSDATPFSETEREAVRRDLQAGYQRFKARVAEGRGMELDQVEEVARGRVWTGRQAWERGLVDELGGFEVALRRAKELAELDPERWSPVVTVTPPDQSQLPLPFPNRKGELGAILETLRVLGRERVWALPPWLMRLRG